MVCMFITYTRHRVKDYDQWRAAFEENAPMLTESGITDWSIVQINGDPTDIAVIVRAPSEKEWNDFLALDRKKMEESGVDSREKGGLIGDPEWWTGEAV
jgi:hypothetical protein